MPMPGSTPSSATPAKATIDSENSTLRCFHRRAVPGTSASDSDAVITTAARAGCGRFRKRPGRQHDHEDDQRRADDAGQLRAAPARSATAVREALVLTGKPWKRPAARLAAPMPSISWSPCTSCRCARRRRTRWRWCRRGTPRRWPARRRAGGRGRTTRRAGRSAAGSPGAAPHQLHPVLGQPEDAVAAIAARP